jgi:hypothetical protein
MSELDLVAMSSSAKAHGCTWAKRTQSEGSELSVSFLTFITNI